MQLLKKVLGDNYFKKQEKTLEEKEVLKEFQKGFYPTDENFVCPFCQYTSPKNKHGSARINSTTKTFQCFSCSERRKII